MLDMKRVKAQRVGERCDHEHCVCVREIIWTREDLDSSKDEPRNKKIERRATRSYAALGAGLAPDFPRLRSSENLELYHTPERREERRNGDDLVPWDSPDEIRESHEPSKN